MQLAARLNLAARRKVNLERDGTAESKFKIVLRLSAQQCGKFMGATVANSSARFRRLALKMQIGAGKLICAV